MKIYFVVCLVLGVLLGVLSVKWGVSPVALFLGLVATVIMTACAFAPLYIPNYDRIKDIGQQ